MLQSVEMKLALLMILEALPKVLMFNIINSIMQEVGEKEEGEAEDGLREATVIWSTGREVNKSYSIGRKLFVSSQ